MLRRILIVLGALVLILVAVGAVVYFVYLKPTPLPISAEDRAQINLMPLPAQLKLTGDRLILTEQFGVIIQGPEDKAVDYALERFRKRISDYTGITIAKEGVGLLITYDSTIHPVQPVAVNESYELEITSRNIHLKAVSAYGILRGMESVLQLIKQENDSFYWPSLELHDKPRFPWRGLMIDVCRHWIPKEAILRNLDAMAALKMNVLHWHLSEYQAFRVESRVFPKLHELGSNGQYYTQDEIRDIVEHARLLGIRIVPEFDMPGHTSSFLVGYPELAAAPGPYQLATSFGLFTPVMDPTREEVYDFIDRFIGEMVSLFPDSYYHIGGDEVNYTDWEKNESIQAFMKKNIIADSHALQAYFNERLEKILKKHNRKMIGWDEILNPNLSQSVVVQSWRSHKSLFGAVQQGSQAILSAGYYLDHKLPASQHYQVDPEVLKGGVTIEPDSLNWKQYDLTMKVSDNVINTSLVLYGTADNLRGLFYLMENVTSFETAELKDNQLTFSFQSDFGTIDLKSEFQGDSISGTMSLGLLSFPFKGYRTGGNDMPGTNPPKVEKIKPLTESEKKLILGGEAALWTEAISAENVDSRIWPRTAAIAEKWWSPAELTRDVGDMYRRLEWVSYQLEKLGIQHKTSQARIIHDLAQGKDEKPIVTLVEVLEEVKYYERLVLDITTSTPMNEVVDAAFPESMVAVKFSNLTDAFLADPDHQLHEEAIRTWLIRWRDNHELFKEVAVGNTRLEMVLQTSGELSAMAGATLQAVDVLTGKAEKESISKVELQNVLKQEQPSRASVLIAVKSPLQKLIDAIP
jgi:hexosaminidase